MNWKAGDLVTLKSGGPKMTVAWVQSELGITQIWCDWFDGNKKIRDSFAPEELKVAEDEKPEASKKWGYENQPPKIN